MKSWYLGTIGFSYNDWVGPFYPAGTTPRNYLSYYTKFFNSVEIDSSFHAIPRFENIISWVNTTPTDFKFCLKTPRRITHELGLINSDGLMEEFVDSIKSLGDRIGPILIQLPPGFTQAYLSILEMFLEKLPRNNRYAIEFRHSSWYNEYTSRLLSLFGVSWVAIDFPRLPKTITPTTDFLYIRWIGNNGMFQHHSIERVDKSDHMRMWLDTVQSLDENFNEIYGFFNNDYAGFAAGSCIRFKRLAGFGAEEEDSPLQGRLF